MEKTVCISLTEFMDYVNSSGAAKATVVAQAKKKRAEGHNIKTDYWLQFRNAVKSVHSSKGNKEDLFEVVERVHEDKKDNYNSAVNSYIKYWGKKKITWTNPPHKNVMVGGTRVRINPELGLTYNGKTYIVKLFLHVDDILDKRHADLILSLMNNKMREEIPDNAVFAVLDVLRGKMFEFKNKDYKIEHLLEAEGASFNILWDSL